MKKQIRLLVEGLFKDLYDIEDQRNIDTEISDNYITYRVGDIFYQNKKPYAICCGNNEDFKDNKQRFALLTYEFRNQWCTCMTSISKLTIHNYPTPKPITSNKFIDENGYENTQIMKRNYNLKYFPAFDNCVSHGDNVYLPAINELIRLFLNKNLLNNIIKKYKGILLEDYTYWTSTYINDIYAYCLYYTYNNYYEITYDQITLTKGVRPFLYIK